MAKHPHDLRLKIAIIESRKTQRRAALETRIGEVRFSEIVNRRGAPASAKERERIAKYLDRPIEDLFEVEPVNEQVGAPADEQRAIS